MDFFQAQDNARKRTGRLVILYIAAVLAMIATIYVIAVLLFGTANTRGDEDYDSRTGNSGRTYQTSQVEAGGDSLLRYWDPQLLASVAGITIAVVGLGSLFKTMSLRSGGGVVARSVGGELISPNTTDPQRRRLINVVEEMSIAAGIRMPEVYVLPEAGINAFAAGYSPDDAAVAVSQGALDALTRDELQGVIAHEFSHILNGDMRLNIKIIGLLFGILLLTIIGRVVLRAGAFSGGRRSSKNDKGGGAAIALFGLALIIIGYLGVFFGRLIQAAVSRQREFLADASAVQFTRNPDGIAGALKKIGLAESGSLIENAHATETSHMFFASALRSGISGLFATHPPLAERIKAIDPTFTGDFRTGLKRNTYTSADEAPRNPARNRGAGVGGIPPLPIPIPGMTASTGGNPPPLPSVVQSSVFLAALGSADAPNPQVGADILASIPEPLREAARNPERARAVLLALLYQQDKPEVAAKQDAVLARTLTPTERTVLIEARREIDTMPTWARIPLGDLSLAAIRHMQDTQINALVEAVDGMIAADGEVSLYEYALRKVIVRNLRPPGRPPVLTKTAGALANEISIVLSAVASAGASATAAIQHAYDAGATLIRTSDVWQSGATLTFIDTTHSSANAQADMLAKALDKLDTSTPRVKQVLLAGLVRTVSDDGKVEPAEQELLRAIAAALNCPAPLLV